MPLELLNSATSAVKSGTSYTATIGDTLWSNTAGQLFVVSVATDSVGSGSNTNFHSLAAASGITFTKCYERTGGGGINATMTVSLWYGIATGPVGDITITTTALVSCKLMTVHTYSVVDTVGWAYEGDLNNSYNSTAYDSAGNNGKEVIFFKTGGAEGGLAEPSAPANGWTQVWRKTSGTNATSDATHVTHQKIMSNYDGSSQTPDEMNWATGDRVYLWGSFYVTLPAPATTRRIFIC